MMTLEFLAAARRGEHMAAWFLDQRRPERICFPHRGSSFYPHKGSGDYGGERRRARVVLELISNGLGQRDQVHLPMP
jgi:hypothetical protein